MGGFGTWNFAAAYPDRWAAIAPICGGGNPSTAAKFKPNAAAKPNASASPSSSGPASSSGSPSLTTDPLWKHKPGTWLMDVGMMLVLGLVFLRGFGR